MKKYSQPLLLAGFIGAQVFLLSILSSFNLPDEYKYVKEVNGIRIYYAVKAYSPKAGKTAKKIVFKLKNSTTSPKTLTFKTSVYTEDKVPLNLEVKQCLKGNEENISHELPTLSKEIKDVKLQGEKVVEGGC